jgi:thiamine biosynthesis lipoprotein
MQIGLGGIAKGYGVDRAARALHTAGLNNYYIDGGGDIVVAGQNHGRPWRVAVRHPRKSLPELLTTVELSDAAIVTSGDYERFRILNGRRYHHILDPRTGEPAEGCQSVTVIAPLAESADALATAAFVLGPEKGLNLIARQTNTAALIVDTLGQLHMTDNFEAFGTIGLIDTETR